MFCPKNSVQPERFSRATARRPSLDKFFTLIPVIKSWGCELIKKGRDDYMLAFSILLAMGYRGDNNAPTGEPAPLYFGYIILAVAIVGFSIYHLIKTKK